MNNKSYLKQSFKHLILGILFNLLGILIGYIILETITDFTRMNDKAYLVGFIITPIITSLVLHDPISRLVNYILDRKE